jgi:hypothetical protein
MKSLRIPIYLVVAIIAGAVAWRTVQARTQQRSAPIGSQQQPPSQPRTSAGTAVAASRLLPASDPRQSPSPSAVPPAGDSATAQQDETEQRLGPFQIAGQNYTVVVHRKHIARQNEDVPAVDGVVSMEIVDNSGAVLSQRTFPLWADEEGYAAWSVIAGTLIGSNGAGLVVRFGVDVDQTMANPDANPWQDSQIFGIVDGKLVPFGGPIGVELGKPGADGTYRIVRTLGSQADELPFLMCNGRFCFDVAVRIDWAQGKLTLAQQCAQAETGGAPRMCQYQILDAKTILQRPREVTFVRLYSSPDENTRRPERVMVKPDSKIDILTVEADVEMKQLYPSKSPVPANQDQMQIQLAPNTKEWLHVRVDGKEGWVHGAEDLDAIGLPEAPDPEGQ